jgi:hypothetical protein
MNTARFLRKLTSLILTISASLILFSCGSFQGASYFESDGIYTNKTQYRTEQPQNVASSKGSYYKEYFKNAADGNVSDDEMYFTDTESYVSENSYNENTNYSESSQIPWGEKTTQTEIVIIDRSPNYLWGLSNFAFSNSPFWNNYYFNDPFRFGYGYYPSPFMNPYVDPYFGGFAGTWGWRNFGFYSPYSYYPGFQFGYSWNRWNRWNRNGINNYRYNNFGNARRDYNETVARVKSGRGEKNYSNSTRSSNTKERNAKSNETADIKTNLNRYNQGRGINSLGNTYILNPRNNTKNSVQSSENSRTARPAFGSTLGSSSVNSRINSKPTKSAQSNSQGRFIQSRSSLGARNGINTNSPRRIKQSSPPPRQVRSVNKTYQRQPTRRSNYNNTQRSYSAPANNQRVAPARSYSSGSRSSSSSSRSGSSSNGRRN